MSPPATFLGKPGSDHAIRAAGGGLALLQTDVGTDRIIPARFLGGTDAG